MGLPARSPFAGPEMDRCRTAPSVDGSPATSPLGMTC